MSWVVQFYPDFESEFDALPEEVQNKLLARANLLETFGSELGRPHIDTINGSRYPNMKELRFKAANGVWRVLFAFDSRRCAILLVAGDKSGGSETRFYKQLIKTADERFEAHLAQLKSQPD
ncbi:MAG: type II toxin-antitoxin system RelE/ParE family toxin [Rivularia sp. (in: cyanobacteria)]